MVFKKALSLVMTLLTILTLIAIIDRAAAELFNTPASIGFFFFNTLELFIAFIFWLVKSFLYLPLLVVCNLVLKVDLPGNLSMAGHWGVLPKMMMSFLGSLMVLLANSILVVSGWLFNIIKMMLNFLPWVDIPKDADAITLSYLLGMDPICPTKPEWMFFLNQDNWCKIYSWVRDKVLGITILDKAWFNNIGTDIGNWLKNRVPLARDLLFVDILHMRPPDWEATIIQTVGNIGGTGIDRPWFYEIGWEKESMTYAPRGITQF